MQHHVFVYGTLKRGGTNHRLLDGQRFVTRAQTKPLYRLYSLGDYPAMVEAQAKDGVSIEGEVWEVDDACLASLDKLEGLEEGLYKRVPVPLLPPHNTLAAQGYVYLLSVTGRQDCGTSWPIQSG